MKNNTEQTKYLLEQALRSLPQDSALQGARSHIIAAFNQIGDVEHRRARRENTQQNLQKIEDQRREAQAAGVMPWQLTLPQTKLVLKNLDHMINTELNKLAEMKQAARVKSKPEDFGNSGGMLVD